MGEPCSRKPKFRIGQVVSVKSFYGNFAPGQTGPGYMGKRGLRHGFAFGKIVKIVPLKSTDSFCYFLDGWMSGQVERYLRALNVREKR